VTGPGSIGQQKQEPHSGEPFLRPAVRSNNVFTIPASAPFAETLAKGLIARLGADRPHDPLVLAAATIYLPTRRAARGFGDAFAKLLGGAALLPQFRALGDVDEDDLLFDTAAADDELLPAIAPLRRQLLLAQLVRQWDANAGGGSLSFAQAAALASSLAQTMDEIERQDAGLDGLEALAPDGLALHWEHVSRFLALLRDTWPAILRAEGRMNPAARRAAAIRLLAQRLASAPPQGPIIAAGSTGSIPATAELLGVIAGLPAGAVVLPGLDRSLDAESWERLDPGHPQYGLKQLLERIGAAREAVGDWHPAGANPARELLLRETLRPAPTTDAWRRLAESGTETIAAGLKGLSLIAAADPPQEALAIALALRQALQDKQRTAALVTPDRSLARRVAAELGRWGIAIDDSAGRPLAHASAGVFLCLLAEAAAAHFAPVKLLALLKHPLATLGEDGGSFRARARQLDRWCLRGLRPDSGLAGIASAIARAQADPRNVALAAALAELARWWSGISAILAPLEKMFARTEAALSALVEAHAAAAARLAGGDGDDCPLWQGADGETAAELLAALTEAAADQPAIAPASYAPLFRALAMQMAVRAPFGQHPRLAILGPLEARLQHFDLTVLGGLNEGVWPRGVSPDPWFSRPMRARLGLEQPERAIGLSAHDFAMLACGPQVLLTRALKADGAPTVASRWLQRLQQLTAGLALESALRPQAEKDFGRLAALMLDVPSTPRLRRPAPTPPVAARPRRLSVTEIETWLRDPYAIYARHVLRLRPLEALDASVGPLERGNALHRALELFVGKYPHALPDDAVTELARIADEIFAQLGIPKAALALWRPRFLTAARWFVELERSRRAGLLSTHLEVKGRLLFQAPGGDFELHGRADRIDVLKSGGAAILDYKTGALPKHDWIVTHLTPQLPLEAAILAAGGFDGLGRLAAEELIYLRLSGGAEPGETRTLANAAALASEAAAKLAGRIAWFDRETTAYPPRLFPRRADIAGDYDHLARVREWSPSGWAEEEA
jgi:ATP-dependent helicase/nuclease subunit B